MGGGVDLVAVEVNGTDISLQEFQRAYQNTRQQWQSLLGGTVSIEQEPALKQSTVDTLIGRELIRQINESMGVRIGDEQLTDMIKSVSQFQGVNGFDSFIYEQSISQLGLSSSGFEEQMRADMASVQLQGALLQSSFITQIELQQLASLMNQERDLSYAILSSNDAKESIEVDDDEIKIYYDERGQEYMEPEQVRIAYVELSLRKMSVEIQVDEDKLLSYYENNKALYDIEDQRKFKQLFIATGEAALEERIAEVKVEVQTLYELIKAGSSFEEAVAANKDETSSNVEVIDQEYMTKGIMEPAIDEVLFTLNEGDISGPIETDAGIQLIRLEKIMGGVNNTFENVREQLEQDYRLSLAEPNFADDADQLINLAFEQPDTLDVISEELGLTIYESAYFDRQWQANELLRNPKIVNASFSEDVLLAGNNSDVIEIDDNRLMVLRVVEHKAVKKKPLEEVRDRIITRIKFERSREETRSKGEDIINDLKNNTSHDDIATQHNFEWQQSTGIKRDDPVIDSRILRAAFGLGRPQQDQTLYGGSSMASGDYAIIMVEAVQDADPGAMTSEELTIFKNKLERLRINDTWVQFLNDIKAKSKIRVYSNSL